MTAITPTASGAGRSRESSNRMTTTNGSTTTTVETLTAEVDVTMVRTDGKDGGKPTVTSSFGLGR